MKFSHGPLKPECYLKLYIKVGYSLLKAKCTLNNAKCMALKTKDSFLQVMTINSTPKIISRPNAASTRHWYFLKTCAVFQKRLFMGKSSIYFLKLWGSYIMVFIQTITKGNSYKIIYLLGIIYYIMLYRVLFLNP